MNRLHTQFLFCWFLRLLTSMVLFCELYSFWYFRDQISKCFFFFNSEQEHCSFIIWKCFKDNNYVRALMQTQLKENIINWHETDFIHLLAACLYAFTASFWVGESIWVARPLIKRLTRLSGDLDRLIEVRRSTQTVSRPGHLQTDTDDLWYIYFKMYLKNIIYDVV